MQFPQTLQMLTGVIADCDDGHQHFQLDFPRANGHCDLVQRNNVTLGRYHWVSKLAIRRFDRTRTAQSCVDHRARRNKTVSAVRAPLDKRR